MTGGCAVVAWVGEVVGAAVGAWVGAGVGAWVGAGVGAWVWADVGAGVVGAFVIPHVWTLFLHNPWKHIYKRSIVK